MNYSNAMSIGIRSACMTFIKRFWPSMLTLGVILYATLNSDPIDTEMLWEIPYYDKLIHAIMMGGLLGAIAFDWQRCHPGENALTPRTMLILWIGIAIFGGADELGQAAMDNGRGCEFLDFVADMVGATVAVFLAPVAIHTVLRNR